MTEPKIEIEEVHYKDWMQLNAVLHLRFLVVYEGVETQMVIRSFMNKIMQAEFRYNKKLFKRKVFGKIPNELLKVNFGQWEFRHFYFKMLPIIDHYIEAIEGSTENINKLNSIPIGLWHKLYNQGLWLTGICCIEFWEERKERRDELPERILGTETLKELI